MEGLIDMQEELAPQVEIVGDGGAIRHDVASRREVARTRGGG